MNGVSRSTPVLVWHIFRKDLKLLWPLATGIFACELMLVALIGRSDPFGPTPPVLLVIVLLRFLLLVGIAVMILMAVQQDPIPGAGQDWLARPIRRRDLILAKLLFVVLVVHAPIIVLGLLHGLWDGFSFAHSLAAALSRNLLLLLVFSLPLVTIGALTRNLTEALVGALALATGLVLTALALGAVLAILHIQVSSVTVATGIAWVWQTVSLAVLLVAMAAILTLQYARRLIWPPRIVFGATLLLCALLFLLPWRPAFALQAWLSPHPAADSAISVAFDSSARLKPGSGAMGSFPAGARGAFYIPDIVTVDLPLRFSGLPAGSVLHVDRSQLRVVDAAGKTLYSGGVQGLGLVPSSGPGERPLLHVAVPMLAAIHRQLMDRSVRLEIEESLTLLRPRTLPPLPALGGDQHLPGVGRCATRVDDTGAAIHVGCVAPGELPDCLSMVLTAPTGARNPAALSCTPNYAPWRESFSLDALSSLQTRLPFRDPSGRAHFPVGGPQLHNAQVMLTVYEPVDHFFRGVVVPHIRLGDLESQALSIYPTQVTVGSGPGLPPPPALQQIR